MSLFGIVLSLVLLMVLVYRGWPVLIVAPAMALLAAAFDPSAPLLATYTQVFMPGFGGFVIRFLPLILLGAVFARLLDVSGGAHSIAAMAMRVLGPRHALLAVVVTVAALAYCGLTIFAIIFAAYPLAAALFRQADIPRRLIPAAIVCGIFPASVALPGAVQVFNVIPAPFFGTTSFAAPAYGLLAAGIMIAGGLAWLSRQRRLAASAGEGYEKQPVEADAQAAPGAAVPPSPQKRLLPFGLAILPLILVAVSNLLFSEVLIPRWDSGYLADARFGATQIHTVRGSWAMLMAMAAGVVALMVIDRRSWPRLREHAAGGASGALAPALGVASEVGYGAAIASLVGFGAVKDFVFGLSPAHPLVSEAVAVNLLAGITGSASGGLSIAMQILGEKYLSLAQATGLDPALLHRVATVASAGLDSLPHSGGVIALLAICQLSHRQAYKDIAMVSIVMPLAATTSIVILGSFLNG